MDGMLRPPVDGEENKPWGIDKMRKRLAGLGGMLAGPNDQNIAGNESDYNRYTAEATRSFNPQNTGQGLNQIGHNIANGMLANRELGRMQRTAGREKAAWGMLGDPTAMLKSAPVGGEAHQYALKQREASAAREAQTNDPVYQARLKYLQSRNDRLENAQPERKIIEGADGFKYYQDDQSRVLPDVNGAQQNEQFKNFGDQVKLEQSLRKEHSNLSKTYRDVRSAYDRLGASVQVGKDGQPDFSQGTGASDISMIFNFMKMLDPGSVVREGEFATAQNSGGVPSKIVALYNSAVNGQRLAPDLRKNLYEQAGSLYEKSHAQYSTMTDRFGGLLKQRGLEPGQVLMDYNPAGPQENTQDALAAPRRRKYNPERGEIE